MKKIATILSMAIFALVLGTASGFAGPFWDGKMNFWGPKVESLSPQNGMLSIPASLMEDGQAHHFKVRADDGVMVTFFTLKSRDGVIRAAVDACDVCYRSGKGYVQSGDFMICQNCGQQFASDKINVIRGGCNPAPLEREIKGQNLIISMADINKNSWYCRYKR